MISLKASSFHIISALPGPRNGIRSSPSAPGRGPLVRPLGLGFAAWDEGNWSLWAKALCSASRAIGAAAAAWPLSLSGPTPAGPRRRSPRAPPADRCTAPPLAAPNSPRKAAEGATRWARTSRGRSNSAPKACQIQDKLIEMKWNEPKMSFKREHLFKIFKIFESLLKAVQKPWKAMKIDVLSQSKVMRRKAGGRSRTSCGAVRRKSWKREARLSWNCKSLDKKTEKTCKTY